MSRKHEPHVFIFLQVGHALAVVAELVEGGLELVVVARAAGAAEAKAASAVAPALVVHLRHDDQEAGGGTLLRARGNSSSGPLAAAPVALPAAAELLVRVRDAHW